ncbi:MAG: ParB/RepB/Spo0J family partition protein [Giesbergeria sp.]|uniref:ParB/RepB/Spo0J family partition protein n=1 Tax=Giesbergeria sp. TaxID=2818473 RepID=UPI00262724C0|nr:ParB/RepB/Spo0J family partition protein [Giesbergeria sp.]MDD2609376.1 ParB/RepB/Spo0J family partition protein [Giesbergeria sp.]
MNIANNRQIIKRSGLVTRQDSDAAAANLPRIGDGNTGGKPFLVPIALIHESPYQSYPINPKKVEDLAENLKKNPLSSPIVLRRRRNDGELELIAGRHRLAAYRLLDRLEIEATLRSLDDDEAERLVFYDNLLGPELTDFQKYLGFAQRKKSKGLNQEKLAEEAGVSQGTVSRIMSFDGLPESVMAELARVPNAIGMNSASEFVALAKNNEALAIQAIKAIEAGSMNQKSAMEWMKNGGKEKEKVTRNGINSVIKSGKKNYAKMALSSNRMTIVFSDDKSAMDNWKKIEEMLKETSEQAKKENAD